MDYLLYVYTLFILLSIACYYYFTKHAIDDPEEKEFIEFGDKEKKKGRNNRKYQ